MESCPECDEGFSSRRDLTDHRRLKYDIQQVVCSFCPEVELLKTLSSLRQHAGRVHPTARKELLTNSVAYYFATNPVSYRSVTVPTVTDAAREAREILEHCASLGGKEVTRILEWAPKDWQHMGVGKRKVPPSDTTSQAAKRSVTTVPMPRRISLY